jgi:hypothetical protein
MAQENILPSGADTLLTISGMGGFQYQARGLTQTLQLIPQATDNERSVNGKLLALGNPVFRKFKSRISCTDIDAPPLDGIWPGMLVTVGCAASLSYITGNPGSPSRPEVSGSSYTQGIFTFYRPVLEMMVGTYNENFEEWKSDNAWVLELEEV